jgi:hypothetical protein
MLLTSIPLFLIASVALAQPSAGTHYKVDLNQSDIHWLVYKAGTLSRVGHNHVISVGQLAGDVYVAPTLADSKLELTIPVEQLVVDDPKLRAREGEDFSSVPSEKDIEGTRHNMLSEKVLDAEHHKTLEIMGTGPVGPQGRQELHLSVSLLGRTVDLVVPTEVKLEDDRLEASGKFQLTHEQLGMMPFSVFLGALQVANEMSFSYRVVAHRAE